MATKESLAIRREKADERIIKATKQLAAELGREIPEIEARVGRDPWAREAELAERIADVLEGLLTVVVDVNTEHAEALAKATESEDGEPEEDGEDGDDNTGGSGSDSGESAKEPIKRSKTKR